MATEKKSTKSEDASTLVQRSSEKITAPTTSVGKGKKPRSEGLYSPEEVAKRGLKKFGLRPELVTIALMQGAKEKYTLKEAETLITAFKNREVQ